MLHPFIGPHPGSFTRNIIKPWRQGYNTLLPHGTWGNLTPEEFEQVSRKGTFGKRQAEPGAGDVCDVSLRGVSLGPPEGP